MGQGSPVPTVVILRGEIFFAFGLIFELEVNCSPIFHSQSNKGGFHLYLFELAFINQFYSRTASLFQQSVANDQFWNHFKIF